MLQAGSSYDSKYTPVAWLGYRIHFGATALDWLCLHVQQLPTC